MTIEEAREYWCRRLERAETYSDEHWDAEERHAHADYVDAMTHAITALAICREHEEAKQPKSNGDRIRQMADEELAAEFPHDICSGITGVECREFDLPCYDCRVAWLRKEADEDDSGGTRD